MKTIQQRLQSRISKRRNFIRFVEEDIRELKAVRKGAYLLSELFGYEYDSEQRIHIDETIYKQRQIANRLAEDQKLDKRLKGIVGTINWTRRIDFDLPELV